MRWLVGMALAWGMIAGGVVLLGFAAATRVEAVDSDSWPLTTGRVIESYVTSEEVRETTGRYTSRNRTYYTPVVRYEYAVDGLNYSGDRIAIEGNRSSSAVVATGVARDWQRCHRLLQPRPSRAGRARSWHALAIHHPLDRRRVGDRRARPVFPLAGTPQPVPPGLERRHEGGQAGQPPRPEAGTPPTFPGDRAAGRKGEDAVRRVSSSTDGADTERAAST
jgi:hypothetical protein